MGDKQIPPSIAKLDPQTIQFLISLADNPKNWSEVQSFQRVENLQEEIEKAREAFEKEFSHFDPNNIPPIDHNGIVIDSAGNPVQQAQVILYGKRSEENKRFPYELQVLYETTTDQNGKFTVSEKPSFDDDIEQKFIAIKKDNLAIGCASLYSIGESLDDAIILSDTSILAGTVVDENGNALAGAKVITVLYTKKLYYDDLIYLIASTDFLTTTTDRKGQFLFDSVPSHATAEFSVIADGFLYTFTGNQYESQEKGKYEAGAEGIIITAQQGVTISGLVIDENTGSPVPGVKLCFEKENEDGTRYVFSSCVSKDDGSFTLHDLPGTYLVYTFPLRVLQPQFFQNSPENWGAKPIEVVANLAETVNVKLPVSKASVLEIHVTDSENQQPITNVHTSLKPKDRLQPHYIIESHQKDGVIRFNLPAGAYYIDPINKRGYAAANMPETIILQPGIYQRLEIQMDAVKTISGTVTDTSQNPLSGVDVYIVPSESDISVTDEDGKFEVANEYLNYKMPNETSHTHRPEKNPQFYIVAQDPKNNMGTILKIGHNAKAVTIELSDGYTISGRVVDDRLNPIPQADVFVELAGDEIFNVPAIHLQNSQTDDQGYYSFAALPRGPHYWLSVIHDDFGEDKLKLVSDKEIAPLVSEGRYSFLDNTPTFPILPEQTIAQVVDFVLVRADLAIAGVVVNLQGWPVQNALVHIKGKGQPLFEPVITDANGQFRIEGLAPGKLTVQIQNSPDSVLQNPFDAQAGNENMRIITGRKDPSRNNSQTLPPGNGLVEFLVLDAVDKSPIKGAYVYFRSKQITDVPYLSTNKDGVTRIVLPVGKHYFSRVSRWKGYLTNSLRMDINVEDGQTHKIVVELERKPTYNGTIIDQDGYPVGQAKLSLLHGTMIGFTFVTKADGKFNFEWDAEGDFKEAKEFEVGVYLMISQQRLNLSKIIELTEPSAEDMTITLDPAPIVKGTVTDSQGKPVRGAYINIDIERKKDPPISSALWNDEIRTDVHGRYQFPALPPLAPGHIYSVDIQPRNHNLILGPTFELKPEEMVPGEVLIKDVKLK